MIRPARGALLALVLATAVVTGAAAGGGGDPYQGLTAYAGDTHVHTGLAVYRVQQPDAPHSVGTPEEVLEAAISRGLDFVVISDHSNNLDDPRGIAWRQETGHTFTLPDGAVTASEWKAIKSAVHRFNRPGRFVTFLGLEYTRGTTETAQPGHQVGVFPVDDLDRYCSNFTHNAGDCPGQEEFYAFVRQHGGVAIMAHPCREVTWGHSDWSIYDEVANGLELVGGKCEFGEFGYNWALQRGLRVGTRGGSDSHYYEVGTNDKTMCFARELTRASILEAMKANRCYYVDRFPVDLRLSINGVAMGGDVEDRGEGLEITAEAHTKWETDFGYLELIHDGEVVEKNECRDVEYDDCALSTYILSGTGGYYYVALTSYTDRRIAVSSPIWVHSVP